MQGKYFSSVLQDILQENRTFNEEDYWSVCGRACNLSNKYKNLSENLEEYWKSKPIILDKYVLIERISTIIDKIKTHNIKERIYGYGTDISKHDAYGGIVHKEYIDFLEEHLVKDIDLFIKERDFKMLCIDDWHKIKSLVTDDVYYKSILKVLNKKIKKSKLTEKQSRTLYDLNHTLEAFKTQFDLINEERNYFLKKNNYKNSKKESFIFNIDLKYSNDYDEWCMPKKVNFNLVISHINEKEARKFLRKNNSLFESFVNKGNIIINKDSIKITKLKYNKQNLKKAVEYKKNTFVRNYDRYNNTFLREVKI